jgi:Porin PorA
MRRFLGPVLLGVGVFLVVLAGLLKFFVADRVIVTPVDQYAQTTSLGPGSYLDPAVLQVRSADLVAVRTLKGDVAASNKDTAVWDVSVVLSTGDGQFVRATVDRVATDRRTAEAVNCCGEAVDSVPTRHSGVSYKFPFGTQKQDYQFWDPNAKTASTARYVSEETVQGLTTYKFIEQIPATQIQTQEVPGSLVGESAPSVQAPVFYTDTRTVWVEPKTGVIVKGSQQNRTTLRDSAGQDRTVVLQFDLTFDGATQRSQAQLARDNIGKINLVTTWLPLIGLLVGLVLIAAGLIIMLSADRATARRTREQEQPAEADAPSAPA